ncbi:MAG: RNA-directed DNA polymerase [Planctomycetota bacterium]
MRRANGLFERAVSFQALHAAALRAAQGKKDREEVARFFFDLEPELVRLERELRHGTWRPAPFRTFTVYDPKERTISAAPFRDRVVHHAVCAVLAPLIERRLIHDTYACRMGKGTGAALARVRHYARRFPFFLKLDVEKFFPSVDQSILKRVLRSIVKDVPFLKLLDLIIDDGGEDAVGLPIGNLTSQWFANLYLDGFDHFVKEVMGIRGYLRYMDDLVLLGTYKRDLRGAEQRVSEWLERERRLVLKERATMLGRTQDGVPFLGWRVYPGILRRQRESLKRSVRRLRLREAQWRAGRLSPAKLVQAVQSVYAHTECGGALGLRRRLAGLARADP